MFPKEGIMEEMLYNKNKTYHVMLNERLERVFDRFAVVTCVLGFAFGLIMSAGVVGVYFWGMV